MLDLIIISNPRTANGGWEDEKHGCDLCEAISSVYIEVCDDWLGQDSPVRLRFCLGCIHKAIDKAHAVIMDQCERGRV